METSIQSSATPYSVRLAVRLEWLFVITIMATKLWPYWRIAVPVFPAETNWIARLVALLFASLFLMFTPVLIGQLVSAVCLVLLARRHGWARMIFAAAAVATMMVTIASMVSGAASPDVVLLYVQLLLIVLQIAFLTLFFRRESSDWFKSKLSLPATGRSRVDSDP